MSYRGHRDTRCLCPREQVDPFPFRAIAAVKLDGKPQRLASRLFAASGKSPPLAPYRGIRPENQSARVCLSCSPVWNFLSAGKRHASGRVGRERTSMRGLYAELVSPCQAASRAIRRHPSRWHGRSR